MLVDGRNVIRSRWPNLNAGWFLERTHAWAEREGVHVLVVFDGRAPAAEPDERAEVVGSGRWSADDWIAERAARLAAGSARLWLVSSDRSLRARVAPYVERTIGGGKFVSLLEGDSDGDRALDEIGRAHV